MPPIWQSLRLSPVRWLPLAAAGYSPVVLGLAAFLAALLCCRTAPPEYEAEAMIRCSTDGNDETSADIKDWLESAAVRESPELQVPFTVTPLHQPGEAARLAIVCKSSRGAAAISTADHLALQVANHYEPARRALVRSQGEVRLTALRQRLRLAQEAEDRQRDELQLLRNRQLALTVSAPRGRDGAGSESGNLNPRWVELKKQLDALLSQKAELKEVLQENHPEMAGLSLRIAKVSGSLAKTPRNLTAPIEPISHNASTTRQPLLEWRRDSAHAQPDQVRQQQFQQDLTGGVSNTARQGLDPVLNLAAQIDDAAHELALRTSQRKGVEWEQTSLEQSLASFASGPLPAWQPQPARCISKMGGGYTTRQLWWASLCSLAAMGLALATRHPILAGKKLMRLSDVLVNVRLPLVGSVEVLEDASSAATTGVPILRLLTRCGEAFLLGILATCLAMAWFDPSLAAEFQVDLLGALAETARQVL